MEGYLMLGGVAFLLLLLLLLCKVDVGVRVIYFFIDEGGWGLVDFWLDNGYMWVFYDFFDFILNRVFFDCYYFN